MNNDYFKFDKVWIYAIVNKLGDLFARCEKIGVAKLGKKFMVNN
jgi:hypothetical protein